MALCIVIASPTEAGVAIHLTGDHRLHTRTRIDLETLWPELRLIRVRGEIRGRFLKGVTIHPLDWHGV
jgi:hypothetical protein